MELMDEAQRVEFLWRLMQATTNGQVSWQALGDYKFGVRVGRFIYTIESDDGDDYAPYSFNIYRAPKASASTPDDSASTEAIDRWEWDRDGRSATNSPLMTLYTSVKRMVFGLDSTVAEMFEDLSKVDGGEMGLDA